MTEAQGVHYTDIIPDFSPVVLTQDEIMWAISSPDWQIVRVAMKGTTTMKKLETLRDWLAGSSEQSSSAKRKVQVMNYINAIKRGGQLDINGYVQR